MKRNSQLTAARAVAAFAVLGIGTAEAVSAGVRAVRECTTHAMRPHEWASRLVRCLGDLAVVHRLEGTSIPWIDAGEGCDLFG